MRIAAQVISIVFHPLLILFYMSLVLLWTNPFSFGWRHVAEADTLLIIIGMTSITLPALAVIMMKALGWVDTYQLDSKHERIGPYIVAGIMYLSLYLHITRADTFPLSLRVAVLGTLIALWVCFFINNFSKVSSHAAGVGGLVALISLTKLFFGYDHAQIGLVSGVNLVLPINALLYGSIVIAGVVCTARLILKAHHVKEVYTGFVIGVLSIVVAYFVLH
jgi:membrane-associated phospholipid phosphatase